MLYGAREETGPIWELSLTGGFGAPSGSPPPALQRGLARDLGPRGITATVIHPGPIDTRANPADSPQAPMLSGVTALGRYGSVDDIASTVAHLAGEGGRYITGSAINVDGGFAAWPRAVGGTRMGMPLPEATMRSAISSPAGAGDIAVEDRDAGDERFQARPSRTASARQGLGFDDQHSDAATTPPTVLRSGCPRLPPERR
jgi:hypothetical protein